tara:strand:+ start:316 stop:444 length:129 start_codon:yes stop_codon:yes gene_type:complete
MGKPGPKAYSIINDLLKKGSPFKQQKLPMNNSSMYAYKKYMK